MMPLQCRTCAEPIFNANPRNLFNHENEDIRQNIEALTGIKLSFDSRLPSHICSCCYLDLDHSMAFRLRCLDANTNLLSHKHSDSEDLHHLDPLNKNEIIEVPNNAKSFEGKTNMKISGHISKSNHLNPRVRIRRFQNPVKNGTKPCRSTTEQDDSKPMYDIAVAISENIKKAKKKKPRVTSSEKKYICHVCGWAFSDLSNMKDHALRHSGIKKFQCQECISKFFTRSQLLLHVRVHHKGEMPFVCKYCGMGFRNSPSRCRHELKFHANQLPFACNICPKAFVSKISLNNHKQTHETGEVIYRCEPCNKTFKAPIYLRNHYITARHRRVQEAHEKTTASAEVEENIYSDDDIDFEFADSIIEEVDE
ncbi:zinc finger protein 721-like [Drosophila albomicans]|uniref:Zinc finger protein 721-like n=1 Tax=Drosophila albomicans TaxID=7291 RepID=A0A9C6T3A8_DROAB|nr:zinc finger protein 721-like [Drosophila albomicans]